MIRHATKSIATMRRPAHHISRGCGGNIIGSCAGDHVCVIGNNNEASASTARKIYNSQHSRALSSYAVGNYYSRCASRDPSVTKINAQISWRKNASITINNYPSSSKQFSTTASATNEAISNSNSDKSETKSKTNTDDDKSKNKNSKSKKDDSNIFLDNLGKIFLSSIGIVLLMLLRSTKSNNSRLALREDVESASILDPMEIFDLRDANNQFTIEVWEKILEEIKVNFPSGKATYAEFLAVVVNVMRGLKGEEFTIQLGHLVDRVVIAELERVKDNDGNEGVGIGGDSGGGEATIVEDDAASAANGGEGSKLMQKELPLSFLLATLSLALHSTVADRVRVLYDSMLLDNASNETDNTNGEQQLASGEQVTQMIQHLQNTCQLVPDAQIVETNSKVPYQTFRVGTGAELTERARRGFGGKKGATGVTKEVEGPVALDEFHAILRSKAVCAWGECYVKKVGAMATSDK